MEIVWELGGRLPLHRRLEVGGLGCDIDGPENTEIAESVGSGIVFGDRVFQEFDLVIGIHPGEEVGAKAILEAGSRHVSDARVRLESR